MSDNIPIEIQMEIIKKVYDVKTLIRFKSVSKQWKSFIESPEFVIAHASRHTQSFYCNILCYREDTYVFQEKYVFLLDDDNNDTPFNKSLSFVVSPNIEEKFSISKIVGVSHGLVCLYGFHKVYKKWAVVFSNPSIRKSTCILAPYTPSDYCPILAFEVCSDTLDPIVVKLTHVKNAMFWLVEVFTLSTGVWSNVTPTGNCPRGTIKINDSSYVVLDRLIYWAAYEIDDDYKTKNMLVSFDLVTKEFRELELPDSLTNETFGSYRLSVSKVRESLIVCGCIMVEESLQYGVWLMEDDLSFRKLYTIDANVHIILGFRKSGEAIIEPHVDYGICSSLHIYDPCSKKIKNLKIVGVDGLFYMGLYNESMLLNYHQHGTNL